MARWLALGSGALALTLAIAKLGDVLARAVGQPGVVGEIAFGLLAGPLLVWWGGEGLRSLLFGEGRLDALSLLSHAGLVLYLVGVGHELKRGVHAPRAKPLVCTTLGTLVVPALTGLAMALWVSTQDLSLRGNASTTSFVLVMVVALSVTAVPVLARILAENGRLEGRVPRLALGSASLVDMIAWILLVVAISSGSLLNRLLVLAGVVVLVLVARQGLRLEPVRRAAAARPLVTTVLAAAAALGVAAAARTTGVNEVVLAIAIGLALPADPVWSPVAERVSFAGRRLVPVFFFVTGLGVFAARLTGMPWMAIALVLVLAIAGKVGGSYLGARLGGCSHRDALELGVLLNTRGLTELVVLQAAFAAKLLTPALYLVMVVMTLVTTAMTGPLQKLLDRRVPVPDGERTS